MFTQGLNALSPGGAVMPQKQNYVNRTGATILKGQVVMVDVAGSATESTSDTDPASSGWNQGNVVTCTQAGVDAGYPCVVADQDILDDASGPFVECGLCEVAVSDDDISTTDADLGDSLQILVSESATAVQEWLSKATSGARRVGVALEDAAADSNVTARTVDAASHLRWCIWWGGLWGVGASDT